MKKRIKNHLRILPRMIPPDNAMEDIRLSGQTGKALFGIQIFSTGIPAE